MNDGLKGSEKLVYDYLKKRANGDPIGIYNIANATNYHPDTVRRSLNSLVEYGMIDRSRQKRGQAYRYEVLD